jgi:TatA/E family protein of Tat protein translocase
MPQLGPAEILVVLVIALMVFGPKRLPEVGRQVGRGLRELRKIQDTVRDEINDVIHAPDPAPTLPPITTYSTSGTRTVATGRPAPSRFRPAVSSVEGPPAEAAAPPTAPDPTESSRGQSTSPRPKPTGTHAPSRFRAPGA